MEEFVPLFLRPNAVGHDDQKKLQLEHYKQMLVNHPPKVDNTYGPGWTQKQLQQLTSVAPVTYKDVLPQRDSKIQLPEIVDVPKRVRKITITYGSSSERQRLQLDHPLITYEHPTMTTANQTPEMEDLPNKRKRIENICQICNKQKKRRQPNKVFHRDK